MTPAACGSYDDLRSSGRLPASSIALTLCEVATPFTTRRTSPQTLRFVESLGEHDYGFVHQVLSFERLRQGSWGATLQDNMAGLSSHLNELVTYGPRDLTDEELERAIRDHLRRYYGQLAAVALRGRGRDFWRFHQHQLRTLGYPLQLDRLFVASVGYLLGLVLNPGTTAARLRERRRRRRELFRYELGTPVHASPRATDRGFSQGTLSAMRQPDLTIIVSTFDRPDWLAVSLGSILTSAAFAELHGITTKILVVDDGSSTDAAAGVAERLGVGYIRKPVNDGLRCPSGARVLGLERVDSLYVAFFDDDDVMLPRWIPLHVAALEAGHDVCSASFWVLMRT